MKRLAIVLATLMFVVHIPLLDKSNTKVGRLTYLAKTFDTAADCANFLQSDDFKATLPKAQELADQDEATLGDPYCEVVE